MAPRFEIPAVGIEIIQGEPGSGKSFVALRWCLQAVIKERRPVFTNLPIKWRVLRVWLRNRYGQEVANLINPLTQDHFTLFVRRAAAHRDFKNECIDEAHKQGRMISDAEIQRRFIEEYGEHRIRDDPQDDRKKANWITPASLIIVDEMQNWFPQAKQKEESPALLQYLAMHRHMMHKFICITQDRMMISISIRRLAHAIWLVHNRAKERIFPRIPITFGNFGLTAFAYRGYTSVALDLPPHNPHSQPFANFVLYPAFYPHLFRLYSSFTSFSSPHALLAQMKNARIQAGLSESGTTPIEERRMAIRQSRAFRAVRGFRRLSFRLVKFCVIVLVAAAIGFAIGHTPATEEVEETPDVQTYEPPPGELQVVTPQFTRINGQRVRPGSAWNGFLVYPVSSRHRVCMLVGPDGVSWSWTVGAAPIRLGTLDDLRHAESRISATR